MSQLWAANSSWIALLALIGWPSWLMAAPQITAVSLRGLQIGGTTTLAIDGSDLLPAPAIVAPFPLAGQTLKPGAQPNHVEIDVALDKAAAAGIYQIRLANSHGISNSVAVGVDHLEQRPFSPQIEQLPVALHGSLSGTQVLTTRFRGQQHMKLVVDLESRRLGSALKPVLRVKDELGRQIAWNSTDRQLAGDARVSVELPADGEYTVEVSDVLFRAADPSYFRLKLGELQYADLAFPMGVQLGAAATLQFVGSNLAVTSAFDARSIASAGVYPVQLSTVPQFSGSPPQIAVSPHPEVVESPNNARQELPAAPIAVTGRLSQAGEEDQFVVPVTPGKKLRFEVYAQRVHSPVDGVLAVRNLQGGQLAANDDRSQLADPGLDFTVPADTSQLVVAVRDLAGRGGPDFVYRLEISDPEKPQIQLQTETDRLQLPAGSTQVLRLNVDRSNYTGPIRVSVEGLPGDVQLDGGVIPAEANIGLLTLTTPKEISPAHGLTRILATIDASGGEVRSAARTPESAVSRYLPWLRDEIGWGVAEPSAISIAWSDSADQPLPQLLPLGGQLPLSVSIRRAEGVTGQVRLRLISTQPTPKKKVKENNQEKEVDDLERTLRLAQEPMLSGDTAQSTVPLLVPADLPVREWGLVLAADLLGPDNKAVLASATTTVLYRRPVVPFTVEVAQRGPLEVKAGLGETGTLAGKVIRHHGFDQPVQLTLRGLPKDYPVPSLVVPADQSDFSFPVRFPYGTKAGELKEVKAVAVFQPIAERAELSASSNEIPLERVTVVPGEPPPVTPLLTIFEDDESFVGLLAQGGGTATLEKDQKLSGQASLRVTPDQRLSENLPMLKIRIREKPEPGEYRYLRFAWKKQGGASICLQLNHDGTWGPGGSGKPGAKFRYHAGSGGECYGGSLVVDEKLPAEFVVVTRDLFADFGEFTLNGLAFSPVDGEFALFDQLYLARSAGDFEQLRK